MRLTQRSVKALRYAGIDGSAHYEWDDRLPGFGIRVYATGKRSFVITYRVASRKRFTTIGRYGVLTVDKAREKARRMLQQAGEGRDFTRERDDDRAAPTMRDLRDRFLRDHGPKLKASTREEYERIWELHVMPALGTLQVRAVNRADLAALHARMAAIPYQANRTIAVLGKAFALAERWGWRPEHANPCRGLDRYPERAKKRYLSGTELARIGEALRAAEQLRTETPDAIAAFRLYVFTGCRRDEILNARWEHVDLERRLLRLPDSKTGVREVPLNAPALQVLAGLRQEQRRGSQALEPCPWVVRGALPGSRLVNIWKPWSRIKRAAGITDPDVTLHTLRHSFASFGVTQNLSLHLVGGLLGHSQPATTKRYAHLQQEPLHAASERVGSTLADFGLLPVDDSPRGEVLRHPRGAGA